MLPHIKGLIGKADMIDNVMSNIVCMVEERRIERMKEMKEEE